MFKRLMASLIILCFCFSLFQIPEARAGVLDLPVPGTMVNLSPVFEPALIKGLTVHKDNPFLFDFILDTGNSHLSGDPLKQEGDRLVRYFFACLTIPEKDLWVNLSPYEKNRMVPQALGQTALGRDLLAQDYILKQLTASLIYPEKDLGKEFWDRVYAKARLMYGTTRIPVNTFNKVWIVADKASVYEHGQTVFVVGGHLKVMLEEDYLARSRHSEGVRRTTEESKGALRSFATLQDDKTHCVASDIVRQLVLPEIEHEVNTGKNFSTLRQIFNSLILASWYKKNLKEALLNQVYADKSTVKGIQRHDAILGTAKDLNKPIDSSSLKNAPQNDVDLIYQQYLKAYKKGVFNYIKEDAQPDGQMVARKYFSGGFVANQLEIGGASPDGALVASKPTGSDFAMEVKLDINNPKTSDKAMVGLESFPLILKSTMDALRDYHQIVLAETAQPLTKFELIAMGAAVLTTAAPFFINLYIWSTYQKAYQESRLSYMEALRNNSFDLPEKRERFRLYARKYFYNYYFFNIDNISRAYENMISTAKEVKEGKELDKEIKKFERLFKSELDAAMKTDFVDEALKKILESSEIDTLNSYSMSWQQLRARIAFAEERPDQRSEPLLSEIEMKEDAQRSIIAAMRFKLEKEYGITIKFDENTANWSLDTSIEEFNFEGSSDEVVSPGQPMTIGSFINFDAINRQELYRTYNSRINGIYSDGGYYLFRMAEFKTGMEGFSKDPKAQLNWLIIQNIRKIVIPAFRRSINGRNWKGLPAFLNKVFPNQRKQFTEEELKGVELVSAKDLGINIYYPHEVGELNIDEVLKGTYDELGEKTPFSLVPITITDLRVFLALQNPENYSKIHDWQLKVVRTLFRRKVADILLSQKRPGQNIGPLVDKITKEVFPDAAMSVNANELVVKSGPRDPAMVGVVALPIVASIKKAIRGDHLESTIFAKDKNGRYLIPRAQRIKMMEIYFQTRNREYLDSLLNTHFDRDVRALAALELGGNRGRVGDPRAETTLKELVRDLRKPYYSYRAARILKFNYGNNEPEVLRLIEAYERIENTKLPKGKLPEAAFRFLPDAISWAGKGWGVDFYVNKRNELSARPDKDLDRAMLQTPSAVSKGHQDVGGIDLNTANMAMSDAKEANGGAEINVDPAMVERVRTQGVWSANPIIVRVTPMLPSEIPSLLGLETQG